MIRMEIHSPRKNRIYPVFGYIISYLYQVAYVGISEIYRIFHVILWIFQYISDTSPDISLIQNVI